MKKKHDINLERVESIPYQSLFIRRNKMEDWADILVWIAGAVALLGVFLSDAAPTALVALIEAVNCVAVVAGVGLSWASSIFCGPTAEFERIGGFVDNGYETKILTKPIEFEYYSNGVAQKGVKRLSANCFENCFFTENVSEKMTPRIISVNLMFLVLFICLAIINFTAANISALFQLLASSVLLENLLKHLYFRHCMHEILERFKLVFSTMEHDSDDFKAHSVYLIMKYEKTLSHYNQPLDSNIFGKLNPKLSKEWDSMKKRYGIAELPAEEIHQ